jgi:ribosomal protein S18 acetylase RimI-like enzyme
LTFEIVPIERRHVAGFREVLDSVARERRFLAYTEAPPVMEVRRFVLNNLKRGSPQFVALDAGRIVGWCDVVAKPRESLRHSGVLGMGVASTHRRLGVGRRLLAATLEAATAGGLSRIELIVRADNAPAIGLYRGFGFATEGELRDYIRIDGSAYDALMMARLAP